MKKVLMIALVLLLAVSAAFAADGRKGKRVWKKNCRIACHDGSHAKAPELSPVSKIQSQWTDNFKTFFGDLKKAHAGVEKFEGTSAEDFDNVYQYLHDHALDSDSPETCG